eukprot:1158867-Pelagomonas_calceolata.AAC.19
MAKLRSGSINKKELHCRGKEDYGAGACRHVLMTALSAEESNTQFDTRCMRACVCVCARLILQMGRPKNQ